MNWILYFLLYCDKCYTVFTGVYLYNPKEFEYGIFNYVGKTVDKSEKIEYKCFISK